MFKNKIYFAKVLWLPDGSRRAAVAVPGQAAARSDRTPGRSMALGV